MGASQQLLLAGATLWTPNNLGTVPTVWWNDSSSVTDDGGGLCSQIVDVRTNGFTFTAATTARPLIVSSGLNGKRTILHDGTSDTMHLAGTGSADIYRNISAAYVFAVVKKTALDGSPTNRRLWYAATNVSGTSRVLISIGTNTAGDANKPTLFARGTDGVAGASVVNGSATDTNFHMYLFILDWTNGDGFIWIDGALSASNTALGIATVTSNTASAGNVAQCSINSGGVSSQFGDLEIAEFLTTKAALPSAGEIDKLFGYAAWHWGLTGNLGGGHPYKTSPPTL